jgi:predicted phosphoribosyltransferase
VKIPWPFYAVGGFYRDFEQTTDAEVRSLLSKAAEDRGKPNEMVKS